MHMSAREDFDLTLLHVYLLFHNITKKILFGIMLGNDHISSLKSVSVWPQIRQHFQLTYREALANQCEHTEA